VRSGGADSARDHVAIEAPLELRLGDRPLTVVMRTPGDDEALALGFLYTEGLIESRADVTAIARPERVTGDEVGNVLSITLRPGLKRPELDRLFYASSSCGVCGKTSISSLAIKAPPIDSNLRLDRTLVATLPSKLRAAQPLFDRTGGLHASGWFDAEGRLLAAREDVGRHNALDKLVGWALDTSALPFSAGALVVSGRVSYEIIQKSLAAGIPIIVAVGAPTSLAIDLAEQYNITLIGFVRDGAMNVYTRPDRLA
jgi:FdhD protein